MARKDPLKSVMGDASQAKPGAERSSYAMRSASKSMKVSIDSLAENSKRLLEGETIVEIDTGLIDASFVNDRLSGDDEAFEELKSSISASGQDTPVLLRPHPELTGRYMVVFGHRRVRAARALGRPAWAVVKEMDDVAHILAHGQENTARADLSFIEKALFAKNLRDLGQEKDVIQQALTIDGTLLSRMLSVASTVPGHVIAAIGPAKQIGRDRWEDFKKLMAEKANLRPIVGISEDAWNVANRILSPAVAAVSIALILDKSTTGEVKSPGGYLRGLVERAQVGELHLDRSFYGRLSGAGG